MKECPETHFAHRPFAVKVVVDKESPGAFLLILLYVVNAVWQPPIYLSGQNTSSAMNVSCAHSDEL
jgi:hypothetical protein